MVKLCRQTILSLPPTNLFPFSLGWLQFLLIRIVYTKVVTQKLFFILARPRALFVYCLWALKTNRSYYFKFLFMASLFHLVVIKAHLVCSNDSFQQDCFFCVQLKSLLLDIASCWVAASVVFEIHWCEVLNVRVQGPGFESCHLFKWKAWLWLCAIIWATNSFELFQCSPSVSKMVLRVFVLRKLSLVNVLHIMLRNQVTN